MHESHDTNTDTAGMMEPKAETAESRSARLRAEGAEQEQCSTGKLRSRAQELRLTHLFGYQPLTFEQFGKCKAVRLAARTFADVVLNATPAGADQSEAIRLIRTAMMTANAAIALNGES